MDEILAWAGPKHVPSNSDYILSWDWWDSGLRWPWAFSFKHVCPWLPRSARCARLARRSKEPWAMSWNHSWTWIETLWKYGSSCLYKVWNRIKRLIVVELWLCGKSLSVQTRSSADNTVQQLVQQALETFEGCFANLLNALWVFIR